MTEEQDKKLEEMKMRIKMEEEKVEGEMERQQVAMADRKMVQLAKLTSRVGSRRGGGGGGADAVAEVGVKEVVAGLERILKASDCVRLKTLKGVLDLLSPMQSVDFLAANITAQLRLGQWGKQEKKDMAGSGSNVNQDK